MANTLIPGYPRSVGGKTEWVFDHDGPTSYTTGGEVLTMSSFGKGIKIAEMSNAGVSSDGVNFCLVQFTAKGPRNSLNLLWFVVATGAQVGAGVNLSGKSVRLQILGY